MSEASRFPAEPRSRKQYWSGWIISAIPAVLLLSGGVNGLMRSPQVLQGLAHLGFSESALLPIALIEWACAILYLVPRTAFFGAILLTAYFGGAVAAHVRIGEAMFFIPIVFGVVVWLGLYLREPRFHAYLRS